MSWLTAILRPSSRPDRHRIRRLPLDRIFQNPYQPRRLFDPSALEQLKRSIRQHGVLVPILVRPVERGYELACGERRLRASRDLGLRDIPAIVRPLATPEMLEIALCENLARAGLTPLEEAETWDRLRQEFVHLAPDALNEKLGLVPADVTRYQRLLDLCPVVKRALATALVSTEHALLLADVPGETRRHRLLSLAIAGRWDTARLAQAIDDDEETTRGQ